MIIGLNNGVILWFLKCKILKIVCLLYIYFIDNVSNWFMGFLIMYILKWYYGIMVKDYLWFWVGVKDRLLYCVICYFFIV